MPKIVKVAGPVTNGGAIPSSVKPDPSWGSTYSQNSGFTVVIADKVKAFVFLDQRLFGDTAAKRDFVEKPSTIARVVGKLPKIDWRVEAEPIDGGQLGLVIYNERGKALLAGTYKLKGGICKLTTLYPGITNRCKQSAKVKVTTETAGGTKVEGEYSIEYES